MENIGSHLSFILLVYHQKLGKTVSSQKLSLQVIEKKKSIIIILANWGKLLIFLRFSSSCYGKGQISMCDVVFLTFFFSLFVACKFSLRNTFNVKLPSEYKFCVQSKCYVKVCHARRIKNKRKESLREK